MKLAILQSTTFAIRNTTRNWWLSLITIFVLVLTTISITLVGTLNVVGSQVINSVQGKVDIDLYFYDSVQEEQVLETKAFFEQMDGVDSVVYVSKEEALKRFVERHQDDPEILASLEELGTNVLPASLVVRGDTLEEYPIILNTFEESEYSEFVDVTDYSDSQRIITTISSITDRAYQVGISVSVVFVIISVIVIFNTLRIAIYTHREEIGIMKLVGATNWFIRSPFVLEGVLLGAVAAAITVVIFFGVAYVSDPAVTAFFSGYDFSLFRYFKTHSIEFIVLEFAGAILLSVLSSMFAITRYLKV